MGHPVLSHAGPNPMLDVGGRVAALPPVASPQVAVPQVGSVTPDRESGGAAVLEKAPERVRKPSPRYKVLLHNDPVNSMEYVVTTLRQVVPSLSEQDAIAVMLEAHNTGIGLVIVCDIEPAEFYCETLKAKGLSSTIEPES
jgi:ATP-dependent Clp protease adaptor protein ClpS